MPELGGLGHFALHRDEYLTRGQAAARIHVSRRTIERYVAAGLPNYDILGTKYVHLAELLAAYREHLKRNPTRTRDTPTSE